MARKKPNITVRSIALASAFAVICLVFIIVMGAVQIKGPQTDYTPGGDNSRTVTVSGLRGEIYDKNGVKLVGNSTHHVKGIMVKAFQQNTSSKIAQCLI